MKKSKPAVLFTVFLLAVLMGLGQVPSAAAGGKHSEDSAYTDQLIVKFRDPALIMQNQKETAARMATMGKRAGIALSMRRAMSGNAHVLKLPQWLTREEVATIAAKLSADPDVIYVEPDRMMKPTLVPNDPNYSQQWHYFDTYGANLPAAWDVTTGSADVVVAVIDTGILPNHEDILGRTVAGYDFIGDTFVANDGDGRDADPSDPGDWVLANQCGYPHSAQDSSWHGTHVAGTIGAATDNGLGVAGINWMGKILPVRVLGKCGGYTSDIVDGMRWAAGLTVSGVPANANPAQVLNLSLGGSGPCSTTEQTAIDEIVAAGTVVVIAAGNSDTNASNHSPGNCDNVITVAATDKIGGKAYYSNYGSVVEISAPGGAQSFANDPDGVLSTLDGGATTPANDNAYIFYQGTSMAAPHVAGIVSLILSEQPLLTPTDVLQIIQDTASAFATGTGDDCTTSICGAGIIDAAAAVEVAANTIPSPNMMVAVKDTATGFTNSDLNDTYYFRYLKFDDFQIFGSSEDINIIHGDVTFNGAGTWSGSFTAYSSDGTTNTGPFNGTYSVSGDGSLDFNITGGAPAAAMTGHISKDTERQFVVLSQAEGSSTSPNQQGLLTAVRAPASALSLSDLNGTWYFNDLEVEEFQDVDRDAENCMATISFDGAGIFSGTSECLLSDGTTDHETFSGEYSYNAGTNTFDLIDPANPTIEVVNAYLSRNLDTLILSMGDTDDVGDIGQWLGTAVKEGGVFAAGDLVGTYFFGEMYIDSIQTPDREAGITSGSITFDGVDSWSASGQTFNSDGTTDPLSASGTYTVEPNGSFTLLITSEDPNQKIKGHLSSDQNVAILNHVPPLSPSIDHTLFEPMNETVSQGGLLGPFYAQTTNNTASAYTITLHAYIGTAAGNWHLMFSRTKTLAAGETGTPQGGKSIYISVSASAGTGMHYHCVNVYDPSSNLIDQDCFPFEVTASIPTEQLSSDLRLSKLVSIPGAQVHAQNGWKMIIIPNEVTSVTSEESSNNESETTEKEAEMSGESATSAGVSMETYINQVFGRDDSTEQLAASGTETMDRGGSSTSIAASEIPAETKEGQSTSDDPMIMVNLDPTVTDPIVLDLFEPEDETVSQGGLLGPFYSIATNNSPSDYTFEVHPYIGTPADSWLRMFTKTVTLAGDETSTAKGDDAVFISVPDSATTGIHYHCVDLYDTSLNLIDQDCFAFEVTPGTATEQFKSEQRLTELMSIPGAEVRAKDGWKMIIVPANSPSGS